MNGESSQLFDFAIHTHVSRVCRGSPGAGAKGNIIPFCIYYEIKAYNVSCAMTLHIISLHVQCHVYVHDDNVIVSIGLIK